MYQPSNVVLQPRLLAHDPSSKRSPLFRAHLHQPRARPRKCENLLLARENGRVPNLLVRESKIVHDTPDVVRRVVRLGVGVV